MFKWSWLSIVLLWSCLARGGEGQDIRLTVATDVWPPFRILQADGRFTGLDMDILAALQARTGIRLVVQRYPWGRALHRMQSGQVDLMIGLARTGDRAAYIDYLQPAYYQCRPAFYGEPLLASQIRRYQDLLPHEVGYVLKSVYFSPFDEDARLDKHGVATEGQLLGMMARGYLPLMIGTDCQVDYALSRANPAGLIKTHYRPDQAVTLYLGMSKQSPGQAHKARLEQALAELVSSGEVERLAAHYRPASP
ncbi:substrate-binding periplasmic protein [Aeromonas bivalvium]|uniref:substrate-binding periplasmic protein n=1 Tax=Aeromonas bivalvium TaxID=440079 RepID=UPI00370C88BD